MNSFFKKYFISHEGNNHTPRFFHEAFVTGFLAVLLVLFASSQISSYIVTKTTLLGNVYSSVLVDLTNQDRKDNNVKPLVVNPVLEQAAKLKVKDMVSKDYFAHTSPEGLTPWHWFSVAGYKFAYAGENLAVGFSESSDVNQGWLNSPLHKKNIVDAHFTEIGIATMDGKRNGRDTTYVVQLFGQPRAVKPATVTAKNNSKAAVLGAEIANQALEEPVVNELYNDAKLVVAQVQDINTDASTAPDQGSVEAQNVSGLLGKDDVVYSTWYQRLLVSEPYMVQMVFSICALIVFLALLVFIFHEARVKHTKHLVYGIVLLGIVIALMYFNQTLLLTHTVLF